MRDTEVVFGDLKDESMQLQLNKSSPVAVRRSFGRILTLSQQLTESMRKEFKHDKGQDWVPSKFEGWDDCTSLFKKLRREDYHQFPIEISVKESQHYLIGTATLPNGEERNFYQIAIVEWGIGDPFSTKIPKSMKLIMYDENHLNENRME